MPEMITGARGPRDQRTAQAEAQVAERRPGALVIPDNEVWFQAKYRRYRVQLTAPQDERLPDGRIRRGAPIVAQFDDYFLRLKLDKKKDEEKLNYLLEHDSLGTDFWNFQTILDAQKESARTQAVSTLADPEQRKLIIAALQAEGVEFELPNQTKSRKAGKKGEAEAGASDD